ncbi:MICAL-like protein 2 [Merluccius polli]|uniref:MICAL-like protein 2 n=1 Tax=Merluccius polli TaxID=89951 RepID=A0AA47NXH5_MERPO|nr:MICAL-like protein 2 [Merluccius polli]
MAAIKALERWCRTQVDGYRDAEVLNMTTSFRDGLAFCALIHKYRPDLIDYESLKKEDVFQNNHLAFRIAEEKLGIPALLDAEDMVALRVPDRLSILTYVSQYYNYFNGRTAVGGVKRPAEVSKEKPSKKNLPVVSKTFVSKTATEKGLPSSSSRVAAAETSPTTASASTATAASAATAETTATAGNAGKSGTLNSKCVSCRSHVHLVQRHFVDGKLYHRSCFRCSECSGTLHAGAYRVGAAPETFVCKSHKPKSEAKTLSSRAAAVSDPPSVPSAARLANVFPPASAAPSNDRHHQHHHPASTVRENGNRPALPPRPGGAGPTQPAPRPASVLTTPATPVTAVTSATPVTAATPSAQKTQAARLRFFQTAGPAAQLPQRAGGKPPDPAGASGRPPGGPKEKSEARAPVGSKPSQENCNNNNNNAARHFTVRSAKRRFGDDPGPDGGAGLTQGRETQGQTGTRTGPPTPTGRTDAGSSCLKAANTDRTRLTTVYKITTGKMNLLDGLSGLAIKAEACQRGSREKQRQPEAVPERAPPVAAAAATGSAAVVAAPEVFPGAPSGDPACGSHHLTPATPQPTSAVTRAASGCPAPNPTCPSPLTPAYQGRLQPSGSSGSKRGKYLSPADASSAEETRATIRTRRHIPPDQIAKELGAIEAELAVLEKEGVELEKKLRSCEEGAGADILMDPVMGEWFNLIRKKQMYFRKESELVYIARTQDLELLQPGVEGELRSLLEKPDNLKSTAEQEREQRLMERLVEIVNGRNAIVEVLDEDRLREVEEDQQLNKMMQNLGVKKSPKKRKSSVSKLFRRRSKRVVD